MLKRIFLIAIGLWLLGWVLVTFTASEKTQMLEVQQKFLTALENRRWQEVDSMISTDYEDEMGYNKATIIEPLKQVLGGFFLLSIESKLVEAKTVTGLGMVKAKIALKGQGAGASSMVTARVNSAKKPWFFHWHKRGRWPWSWELVQVHNDELD
jgi:hypothetical protein